MSSDNLEKAKLALQSVQQYQQDWVKHGVDRVYLHYEGVDGDWLDEFDTDEDLTMNETEFAMKARLKANLEEVIQRVSQLDPEYDVCLINRLLNTLNYHGTDTDTKRLILSNNQ